LEGDLVMIKLLHLSDLHISQPLPFIGSVNTAGITSHDVRKMLDYIDKEYPEHYLIVTGDITDNGVEYSLAETLLHRFAGRIFICPGNHDTGLLGNVPSPLQSLGFDIFAKRLMIDTPSTNNTKAIYSQNNICVSKISDPSLHEPAIISLIGIDSNRDPAPLSPPSPIDPTTLQWLAQGHIGKYQRDILSKALAIGQPTDDSFVQIVYLHHHPFSIDSRDPDLNILLRDSGAFLDIIRNKVDVLLFGHKHFQTKGSGEHGVKHWLCSGASPLQTHAREISISGANARNTISIKDIPIR
jgi:3',5'-cyclic AMP phosphodiesterase CpdA